jgi:feruloyl-CoA synthase
MPAPIADVRTFFAEIFTQHNREHIGTSETFRRCLLLTTPPRLDYNETTDKGYINQIAVLRNRADLVEQLYQEQPGLEVIVIE